MILKHLVPKATHVTVCNLTCFDQLTHFIGYITVAFKIGWHLSAVANPGDPPPPFLDQSEARRVNFFQTAPPPPFSEGLDLPLISISNTYREELRSVKSQLKTKIFNGLDQFAPTG